MFEKQRREFNEKKEKVVQWIKEHKIAVAVGGGILGGIALEIAREHVLEKVFEPKKGYLEVTRPLCGNNYDTVINVITEDRFGRESIDRRIGYNDDDIGHGATLASLATSLADIAGVELAEK